MNASEFSVGAAHELVTTAVKVGWELTDFTALTQSEEKCRNVLAYIRGEVKLVTDILGLGEPLNPTFVGRDWKEIAEETDMGAEALTELDLSKVRFVTTIMEGETTVNGEERLKRLKASGQVRLGGKAFMACWNNRRLLPESWKKDESGNTRYITFDGLTLQNPSGYRYVLCLYWDGSEWHWDYHWLDNDFSTHGRSAVIAS